MTSFRRLRLVAPVLFVSAAALLAACGGEDSADPPVMAESPDGATDTTAAAIGSVVFVSPEEGAALIESLGDELTIIDVRTPEEFATGHLEGAVNIDVESGAFAEAIGDLDQSGAYLVYCRSGRRSAVATQMMAEAGFDEVHDMGGIQDWVAAGYPTTTG